MKRVILTAALVLALALPIMAQGAIPQPIYFWGSVADAIRAPNQRPQPEVIRPSTIFMFADGSWSIDHLHWSGWGTAVAHAQGISSASDGIPNLAEGKRIMMPAQITLSNPGRFQGHEVYRCFTLTVAPPATGEHLCLTDQGGYWYLTTKLAPKPPVHTAIGFLAGQGLDCEMRDEPGLAAEQGVLCESRRVESEGGEIFAQKATLQLNGQVRACSGQESKCELGDAGVVPTFHPGRVVTVGRFTCKVCRSASNAWSPPLARAFS
jgi:hypothetical protein